MPITLNGDTGITTPGLTNTGSTMLVSLTTTGNTILGDQSTDTLNVANGNLVLNSSGNLGIGTASPIGVANYQGITIGGTNGGLIRFQSGASTQNAQIAANTSGLEIECVNTGIPIKFYTGGSLRATLDSSGNLGIGTASPAARLDVVSSSYPNFITNRSLSTGGSGSAAWTAAQLKVTTTEQMSAGFGVQQEFVLRDADAVDNVVAAFVVLRDGADNSGALSFRTAAAGTLTERARITSAGNVGIGTTSPSSILTLSQAQAPITTFWGSARADGNPYTAGGIESTFVTRDGVPALGGFIRILDVNTFGAFPTTIRGGAITFGTVDGLSGQGVNATERARIDSSGNLLIGATSTRASSKLDIRGDVMTLGSNGNYYGTIDYNAGTGLLSLASESGGGIRFLSGATERVRITSSGVGIGTTSPGNYILNAQSAILFRSAFLSYTPDGLYGATALPSRIDTPGSGQILFGYTDGGGGQYAPRIGFGQTSPNTAAQNSIGNVINGSLTFNVGTGNTERARIDPSGNFLVNLTSPIGTGSNTLVGTTLATTFSWFATNDSVYIQRPNGVAGSAINFLLGSASTGSITLSGSTTSYNTSSDYRLKNTIAPMTGALARVAQLKPVTYKWNVDGSEGEGFIAHELAEVVPQAVTGEKDAVDEEGNPQYQGIDVSFIVATLTAAIQELKSELDSVKTELAALKGN